MEQVQTVPVVMTGLWKGTDLSNPDFEALEDMQAGNTCMMDYLHGVCTVFALALHDLFGYRFFRLCDSYEMAEYGDPELTSEWFPLIHDFCVLGDLDEAPVFLDCRGAVSSQSLFLEEFRDFFEYYLIPEVMEAGIAKIRAGCENVMGKAQYQEYYENAREYILANKEQFDLGGENHGMDTADPRRQ